MTTAPQSTVVSNLDSKIQSLAAYIDGHLPQSCNDTTSDITLIARSRESPIARALASRAELIAARGIGVRALFVLPRAHVDAGPWTPGSADLAFRREVRWCDLSRFADAHEQLVLGPAASWIGDSMRRDPAKRDALDLQRPACAATGVFAARSFERLWRLGDAVLPQPKRGKSDALAAKLATVQSITSDVIPGEIE